MDEKLKAYFKEIIEKNPNASIDELNKHFQKAVNIYNDTDINEFDGLSPRKMYDLLYRDWGENGITINPKRLDGKNIPMIDQIKYFIHIIKENNGIKLTKVGNLPPSIVKDIYSKKFIPDTMIDLGITKLVKETDIDNIVTMKILCKIAGIIKKRNDVLSLTQNAVEYISSEDLFNKIFDIVCHQFNWSYFDSFNDETIGQFGCNYSLYLLGKYGNDWKDELYYADLYFKAFPEFKNADDYYLLQASYVHRTFDQILKYFGFIEFENKRLEKGNIKTTDLFKEYIKIWSTPLRRITGMYTLRALKRPRGSVRLGQSLRQRSCRRSFPRLTPPTFCQP
jgi:hypothetical protein